MNKKQIAILWLFAFVLPYPQLFAAEKAEIDIQQQVRILTKELKCIVCEGQSVFDSQAEFAVDIRKQVRQHLEAGKSHQEIKQVLAKEYGDSILYTPKVNPLTWLLWGFPILLLCFILGITLLGRYRRF